ncbi:MAG: HAMP domain-containing sensor histidine kinase [Ilumatobacteraceae bacterium]
MTAVLVATPWWDTIRDRPLASVGALVALVVAAAAAGTALRTVTRHTRTLRGLLLVVTFGSLAIGAVAALILARLMVLDAEGARTAVGVLAVTAVFATILVLVASTALARDARQLERTVRGIEAGDRTVRSGLRRGDELGHVAHALDELTARLDQLERARAAYEEERQAMFSSIGHDLRTPLSALRAAVEALADGVAPDPDRYLRSMARDVDALAALIDDLFLLSRIEGGRLELDRHPVDLAELVDEAAEALGPAAEAEHITIDVATTERVPVAGNATALGRVVRNLLDNAIRHAPPGSTVRVSLEDGSRPRVIVADDGPGFPPGFEDRAFERFTRAEPSRSRDTGGSGLGLAIARGLVEAHGGHIWIESPPGGRIAFDIPR